MAKAKRGDKATGKRSAKAAKTTKAARKISRKGAKSTKTAKTYTQLPVETWLNPFNSDHVPFIDAQIPAVLTIEGADSTNHRVHTANDSLDTIGFDLSREILRMNIAFIASEVGSML